MGVLVGLTPQQFLLGKKNSLKRKKNRGRVPQPINKRRLLPASLPHSHSQDNGWIAARLGLGAYGFCGELGGLGYLLPRPAPRTLDSPVSMVDITGTPVSPNSVSCLPQTSFLIFIHSSSARDPVLAQKCRLPD